MEFTKEEKEHLKKCGYTIDTPDSATVDNNYCGTTIVKNREDEFSYCYDIYPDTNNPDYDLERANNNKMESGLTWEKLLNELDLYPKEN